VAVAVGVGVGVAVSVGVGVAVAVGVGVGVEAAVGVGVGVGVAALVCAEVAVGVVLSVAVSVTAVGSPVAVSSAVFPRGLIPLHPARTSEQARRSVSTASRRMINDLSEGVLKSRVRDAAQTTP
jgi:hypothetical protein